jgi:hypothetical protein
MKKRNFVVGTMGWGKDGNHRNMLHKEEPKRKRRIQ